MQTEDKDEPLSPGVLVQPTADRSSLHSALGVLTSAFAFWTCAQRRPLLALSIVLLLFLAIESWRKPALIGDPPPQALLRSGEIVDRLNPNTADAAALAAIPNLGEKKAAEIVEYRESFIRQHPNEIAFNSSDDLLRMKGIGVATVASLAPFLTFPRGGAATTRP